MKNMIAMFFFVLVTSAVASEERSLRGSRGDHNAPNQSRPTSATTVAEMQKSDLCKYACSLPDADVISSICKCANGVLAVASQEESQRGSRGDHNAPNQSGPTSATTVMEMGLNDFCTHGCNSTDVDAFSPACKCANGILAECDNTNGSVKNSKICKCGKRTCTFQTPYCDKRRSSGRCKFPKCDNTDGTRKNIGDCKCGWSICSGEKPYCDKKRDNGMCQRVPKCDNTDGRRKNIGDCKCGWSKCTDKKPFCYAEQNDGDGKCTRRRECKNTDGTKTNGRACNCGSKRCAKNKPFCYKERNGGKCTKTRVAECSNTNRTERNTGPCMCGTGQICSKGDGQYCDKSVNEGRGECYEYRTQLEYEQNMNWVEKKFEGYCKYECNSTVAASSITYCKCADGILAECENTDGSVENSKICKCGEGTCGDQKKYCDKRGDGGRCERFARVETNFDKHCKSECNSPDAGGSVRFCKCADGILAECDNTDGSVRNSIICTCGKATCGGLKSYCDTRQDGGRCETFPTNRAAA